MKFSQKRGRHRTQQPEQAVPRSDNGRIEMLKRKVEYLRRAIVTAVQSGDLHMKGKLDSEIAELQATIFRAESLVARNHPE